MILLSPEELEELQGYDEPANESIGYEANIAKAQLKKVVEWLESYDLEYFNEDFGDWGHLKQGWESNATHIAMPIDALEALKKEAGIDE